MEEMTFEVEGLIAFCDLVVLVLIRHYYLYGE